MRIRRIKNKGEGRIQPPVQQVLFKEREKDMLVKMMRKAEYFCGVEVLSYCVMSNHFRILAHVP